MSAAYPLLGGALVAVLLLATVGDAGNQPDVLLAWHALLLLGVVASWVWAPVSGTSRRPANGVGVALVGLTLVLVAGLVRAPYTYAGWLTGVEFGAFVATMALAARCSPWLFGHIGTALVLGGWAQTGLLVFQRFVTQDPRPAGTFLNPNHLAAWLAATALFCAGHWIASPTCRRARWTAWAALPLVAGLVLTGSRGAWLGLGFGAALLAWQVWPALGAKSRLGVLAGFVLPGVLGAGALAVRWQQPDPYRYHRLKIWRGAITPALAAPWSGTGPGQFSREAPNLQVPDERGALRYDRGFRSTHSDWIRVPAELGWPGAVAFAWVAVSVALHAARRRRGSTPVDPGALAAVGALFVHAAFDNLTRAPAVMLLAAALLGMAIAVEGPARRPTRSLWSWLAVALVLQLFAIGEIAPWRSWALARAGGAEESAAAWNPADAEAAMRHAERRATLGPLELDDYARVRLLAERAVRLSPRDGDLLRRYARIEAAAVLEAFPDRANRERVARLFLRAADLQRSNPFVPLELAAFLVDAGDAPQARRAAERAIEVEPAAPVPRLLLARAFLDAGEPERAAIILDEAEALAREHAAEATTGDYARDLLTLDPRLVSQVRAGIAAARQSAAGEPRFD